MRRGPMPVVLARADIRKIKDDPVPKCSLGVVNGGTDADIADMLIYALTKHMHDTLPYCPKEDAIGTVCYVMDTLWNEFDEKGGEEE